ncbi:MAG: tRNA lysidine(34) synthetase TilS [Hormoscilla sp. SP5CHS1]|nr:tRNA lysidine(34) synthetase TilS [Hormoscilla sp. SP12CHS1]MBC6455620.1 tRNA lysidine(34) synthetase TilS [Hormoscilla sp. SP5CHS1]
MVKDAWTELHAQLHRTLRSRQLLPKNSPILVAVSGGQDSLCSLKLLLDLQPKWGWELAIAHCDHRWRADSQANAQHVEKLAQTWGLPYYQQTATEALNSEAAARQWRYQALSAIATKYGQEYIVTGHTASDRAETLLYNLIRGSGADGLQALTWKRPLEAGIMLVRPLLEITRSQTGAFCQQFHLSIWEDSTNQDLKYARNRIRLDIIPYLQQYVNPKAEENLAKTAELLQGEVEYLEETATQIRDRAQHPSQPGLNRRILGAVPLALQRRVLRQFLTMALSGSPSFDQIEKVRSLISAPNRSNTDPFPGGAIALVEDPWIWLTSGQNPNSGGD